MTQLPLLHQGSDLIPIDFIAAITPSHGLHGHQRLLLANCITQGSALMHGKDAGPRSSQFECGVRAFDLSNLRHCRNRHSTADDRAAQLTIADPPLRTEKRGDSRRPFLLVTGSATSQRPGPATASAYSAAGGSSPATGSAAS